MSRQEIVAPELPPPPGPFSHAIAVPAAGRLVFVSGMTARRADGTIAGTDDVAVQTRQVCENLAAALAAAGGSLADVCRVDVFLRNIADRAAAGAVRRELFPAPLPASTTVEVAKLASPEYLIEISAIAVLPRSPRLSGRSTR